jgi:hypothetical protein
MGEDRAARAGAGLGVEGLEVLAHHALQDAGLGVATHAGMLTAAG